MSDDRYRTRDVAVPGGSLHAGEWEAPEGAPHAVLVHGVTASHRAWPWLAGALPEMRLLAPDLRGRGRSNRVTGDAGMAAHADDLARLMDDSGIERTVVVGHSMGGFVSVVFAHRHPDRVSRLVLVDGGLPPHVPAGVSPRDLVPLILGPTAERLQRRFASVADYLDFWRGHPAFGAELEPRLEEYFAYDLVDAGDGALRPATSYETTERDTIDLNLGTALLDALAALRHPTTLITVPRGLQNEEPGLYAPEYLAAALTAFPTVAHTRLEGFNHYDIVMSDAGARAVAPFVRAAAAG